MWRADRSRQDWRRRLLNPINKTVLSRAGRETTRDRRGPHGRRGFEDNRPRAPIGVFDSGVGGLTVVRDLNRVLPRESILYYADNGHVPYGGRPLSEIRAFALEITDFLAASGVKLIVFGCNISSAVALEPARREHPHIPIIGLIEAGARAAILAHSGGPIGVIATQGTVASGRYTEVLHALAPAAKVIEQACPAFVPIVERGGCDSPDAAAAAEEYVAPLRAAGVRTLIYGCSHYPLLERQIRRVMGRECVLVDPAVPLARRARRVLTDAGLLSSAPRRERYLVSGDAQEFSRLARRFLGRPLPPVERHSLWREEPVFAPEEPSLASVPSP